MTRIKVILGSNRPNRFGIQPAEWIMQLTKEYPEATFELLDLEKINLPFLDEPQAPMLGNYVHEHTKKWAKEIDEADGFIVITAEYNRGPSAALKNAIDFAAKEWYYKPVAFVSYGAGAGGVRAVEQLHNNFVWLRAYNMHDDVHIINYWTQMDDKGTFVPTEQQTEDAHRLIRHIVFWADHMKDARTELKKLES
jgi:NAD(P)H-dependent FMN reductase